MPRKPREYSLSGIYHIISRGNDRQDIFYDNQDRYVFLDRLKEVKEKFEFKINSFCLMDNHVHLVIRIKDEFLSDMMKLLQSQYSIYLNKKLKRSGHLFENRFYSKKIENLEYFKTCCKYIHRNPEKAGIAKTKDYRWSSYRDYVLGKKDIVDTSILLNYFDNNIEDFKKYTLKNNDKEELFEYSEFEIIGRLKDEQLDEIIKKRYGLESSVEISLYEDNKKAQMVKELTNVKGTSLSQISRVTRINIYWVREFSSKQ